MAEGVEIRKPNIKYEFDNEGQYLVAKYREQLQFALFQVEGQYESAKQRAASEIHDIKTFGGSFLVIVLIVPISILMAISGGMARSFGGFAFGLVGCLLLFADLPFVLYAIPLCLYKVVRGFIYLQVSKSSKLGLWLCEKWKIPAAASEIEQCESYIRKYRMILDEIDDLEKDLEILGLEDGKNSHAKMSVDLDAIKIRMANVDTKPTIKVVNTLQGAVQTKIKKISRIATIVVYVLLAILFFRFYGQILSEMKYMFKQL